MESGREGERDPRPPKGKRTVVAKYTRHACAQCKKAKTKCEGGKPVCERCQKTGHECNWSLEDARRPLTRAHEQALKHQNALLRAEVERLTREVEVLRLQASTGSASSNPPSVAGLPSPGLVDAPMIGQGDQVPITSQGESSGIRSPLAPGTGTQHEYRSAEPEAEDTPSPLWGILPVEDIASDAQEDIDLLGSDSEDDRVGRGKETEFDCDVESAYESAENSEDGDSEGEDSDEDVDKALVAPTKTLFSEQDDLHHYGLTSVFRLRRPTSHRSMRSHPHNKAQTHGSAASGYDSVSSSRSQGVRANQAGTSHPILRSFLSSSSVNETGVRPSRSQHFLSLPPTSLAFSDTEGLRLKRDRKGKQRSRVSRVAPRERASSPVRTQRHVLLLGDIEDGAWKGCDCQSDCWNRWLPKGVLLSRREHDVLLDRAFLFFTSWCMRVIPEYFLRDMYTFLHPSSSPSLPFTSSPHSYTSLTNRPSTALPRLAHYSPFLHNTLLAVATAFSSDPLIRQRETRVKFVEEAKGYIEEECSKPNISTVQALGLLASYYSGQGLQTLGFTYFGMSARIAQALGLFADCTPLLRAGRLRPRQVFDRTWCFHMGAAQDACWSLYVGRECGIPLPGAVSNRKQVITDSAENGDANGKEKAEGATNDPRAFSMEDPFCLGIISEGGIGESLDRMTWRMTGRPGETSLDSVPQCKTFTTLQWSCQLMKIGRSIMDLMNRLASPDSATEIKLLVTDIDIQLDAWRQDLPAELKLTPTNEMTALPHKLMMHSAFWWQRILLHRPFYQRHRSKSIDSVFSVTRCNVAARETLSILRLWRKIYGTVRYSPITLIQTIFAAGTIYILQAIQASSGRRPAPQAQASALDNLAELVGYLRECAESWEAAVRIADVFERILKEQRRVLERGADAEAVNGRRKGAKKKRRLETLKENETAVLAAQSALMSHSPSLSDGRANDSGNGGEMSSPGLQPPPASAGFLQSISPNDSQQTLFSPSVNMNSDASPIFASPIPEGAFSFGPSTQNTSTTQLSGASIPSYPTGYLSDESYMSDAPYSGMNLDDWNSSFFSGPRTSASQPPSASAITPDFSFLLNSEGSMDAVMPGMSMFDPTSFPGLALESVSVAPSGLGGPFGNLRTESNIDCMDAYTLSSDVEGFASGPGTSGQGDVQTGMNVTSGDEDDRTLYDMLAALSNHHQF